MKEKMRNYDFHCITKHVGKGEYSSLKTSYMKNKNDIIIKTITNRYEIEWEIMKYNREYFIQAHKTKIY